MKKVFAIIFLLLLIATVVRNIFIYWQTHYILNSPFIPAATVDDIARPYLLFGLAAIPVTILSFVLYKKGKYVICIVMAFILLIAEYIIFSSLA